MRIGLFTDGYKPQISGVTTSVEMLRNELIKRGHEVYIITNTMPDFELNDEEGIIRMTSIPFKKWKELRIGIPISPEKTRLIKSLNLDVIHTHTEFSIGLYGKYFSRSLGLPLVHTYHTMYEDYTHYIYTLKPGRELVKGFVKKVMRQYVKDCDMVIAPTKKTKNALRSYGVKNEIRILPTGVDINHFERVPKDDERVKSIMQKYSINEDDYVLLFLGRVSEEKSIDVIFRAVQGVREKKENIKMLVVGDGPEKAKLEMYAEDLGIDDITRFTGLIPHEEVQYYYSAADLFVNASKTETQGLTILEAMASSLPIIVYNDSNIEEIVDDNITGRLFNDDDEFESKIFEAIDKTEETNRLRDNALIKIKELSKEKFAEGAEKIYQSAISKYKSNKMMNKLKNQNIYKHFSILHRQFETYISREMSEYTLLNLEYIIIDNMPSEATIEKNRLSNDLAIELGELNKMIANLNDKGYIELIGEDKVKLTDKGDELKSIVIEKFNDWINIVSKDIREDIVKNTFDSLDQFSNNAIKEMSIKK